MTIALPITEFNKEFRFLSNFYPAPFVWDSILWKDSETAYQAAKSDNWDIRKEFSDTILTPSDAKRFGKTLQLRSDWDRVKVQIMLEIVDEKFQQNPMLKQKLIDTWPRKLEEGNYWRDIFWGICPAGSGIGKNMLGIILMVLRDNYRYENTFVF